jgi:hypothetical protein
VALLFSERGLSPGEASRGVLYLSARLLQSSANIYRAIIKTYIKLCLNLIRFKCNL